ncbi:hypothetical protein KZ483_11400 [Paenibacillus sp. sptzw28]|uniref:hypothetical protein n=1 Tax=Paenibacillus sp. sptzw28 TaxID=715179 RepID=UPI001C6E5E84|nr:hypothetical protein [Paenibacillus sp. sptzw28]QYR23460.1 hypothetical protein KZ483_11400 [Paenibacillus sp. sptzw28]
MKYIKPKPIGAVLIILEIFIILMVNKSNNVLNTEEIHNDIERRLEKISDSNNLSNFQIRSEKEIGDYMFYVFTYRYKDYNRLSSAVYQRVGNQKYKFDMSMGLTFKLKDSVNKDNIGIENFSFDKYLVFYGIVQKGKPNKFTIQSGTIKTQVIFPSNQFFIDPYVLENPNEYKVTVENFE